MKTAINTQTPNAVAIETIDDLYSALALELSIETPEGFVLTAYEVEASLESYERAIESGVIFAALVSGWSF